jgi:hypothetical protein
MELDVLASEADWATVFAPSTGLPGQVARLLRAVGFEQPPVGGWRFVIEVNPADGIDTRPASSDV